MKLSEISYRDYIAIEALCVVRQISDKSPKDLARETAKRAYLIADAMLEHAGKYENRVKHAEARAEKAETSVAVMLGMNGEKDFHARVALKEIWEALGVDNQTHCMAAIRALVQQAEKLP